MYHHSLEKLLFQPVGKMMLEGVVKEGVFEVPS